MPADPYPLGVRFDEAGRIIQDARGLGVEFGPAPRPAPVDGPVDERLKLQVCSCGYVCADVYEVAQLCPHWRQHGAKNALDGPTMERVVVVPAPASDENNLTMPEEGR